jgi:phospholipase A1/A2
MRKFVSVLVALTASFCFASDISTLLEPVQKTASSGATLRFWVIFLNTGTTAATARLPDQLTVTIQSGSTTRNQTLIRESQTRSVRIEPSGFYRAAYAMTLPANLTGQLIVKLKQPGATPVVLTARPPPLPAPARIADIHPATSPSQTLRIKRSSWFNDPDTEAFLHRFSTYQPMYFIAGSKPTAKFQISLKYQLLDDDGSIVRAFPALGGLNLAYTQTSFWDWTKPSSPFVDNSYRPELMVSYDHVLPAVSDFLHTSQLGMQGGWQHESNGRDGSASRSMNLLYVRPIMVWDIDTADDLFISVAPRVFAYVTSLSDNPDMPDYRGYGDIRVVVGQRYGPQLAAFARVGEDFDKGSLELDLSQPLRGRSHGNLDLYLYAQFFTGYGEELLNYNKETTTIRIGVAFVR